MQLIVPRDGMAVETVCWQFPGLPPPGECYVDTFYREDLLQELVDKAGQSAHVVFGFADSLRNHLHFDTFYVDNRIDFIDTLQAESLWVSIHSQMKGASPWQKKIFLDHFIYVPGQPFATTYTALLDTPFIAFFNKSDTTSDLGIGPLDGCFFEPTAYLVKNGRIYRMASDESKRMPGIWVSVDAFFTAAGLAKIPVPDPRPGTRIRGRGPPGKLPVSQRGVLQAFLHNLRGKRIARLPVKPGQVGSGPIHLPMGWYFLRLHGNGWIRTQPVFFRGGADIAEALGFPKGE